MATYALTFATRAAFDTALASGGDIYLLMEGVTSSNPSVAVSAHITESGETFACGTNVMIDIKSVGPGDYVLYDTTNNKFFGIASKWIDNNRPNQPTQHIMIFKTGVLPARFTVCGTVIKRFGNRIRLAGNPSALPWSSSNSSDFAWNVTSIKTTSNVVKRNDLISSDINDNPKVAVTSLRFLEARFPNGSASYLPITRSTWDAAVAAGNETVTQNGKTATLADYQNDFDKFMDYHFYPKFPVASGVYSDTDGIGNTHKIVDDFIGNHGKTASSVDYAAGYCYNYHPAASVPGLEKHKWFLGSLKDIGEAYPISYTLSTPISWGSGNILSNNQSAANGAWFVTINGYEYTTFKSNAYYTIPLADLIITT